MYDVSPKSNISWQQDAAAPTPEAESPRALQELAAAASSLSEATAIFINARRNLGFAQARFAEITNMVAKAREVENV